MQIESLCQSQAASTGWQVESQSCAVPSQAGDIRQLGMMVGNALSLNVLERLLVRMLRACGSRRRLEDKWQHRRRIKTTRACT